MMMVITMKVFELPTFMSHSLFLYTSFNDYANQMRDEHLHVAKIMKENGKEKKKLSQLSEDDGKCR